jgi:hypothetical protein
VLEAFLASFEVLRKWLLNRMQWRTHLFLPICVPDEVGLVAVFATLADIDFFGAC